MFENNGNGLLLDWSGFFITHGVEAILKAGVELEIRKCQVGEFVLDEKVAVPWEYLKDNKTEGEMGWFPIKGQARNPKHQISKEARNLKSKIQKGFSSELWAG